MFTAESPLRRVPSWHLPVRKRPNIRHADAVLRMSAKAGKRRYALAA